MSAWNRTVAELIDELFDPTMRMADLEWVRSYWDGPLIVKGIKTLEDARTMAAVGVQAIVLSNHGGRQLDRAPVPVRLVPAVVEAIGARTEIWVDTGIMSGADIVAAVTRGAKAALVGRAYISMD
jgi:L-lactate dehydrogenase (cytochrome)